MSVQEMPKVRTGNRKLPGPRGSLVLGCLPEIQKNILPFVERVARDYGDIARIRLLPGFHCVMLSNPDHYRQVLVKGSDKYIKELTHFDILSLLIGKGVITLNREPWRERRKLIQPAFHRQLLSGFADIMTKATGEMLARWRERGPDPSFDIEREMTDLTLTIATRSFLSVDFSGELEVVGRAFAEATQLMAKRWANPLSYRLSNLPTPDNRAFNAAVKTLDDLVYRIIAERRRSNNEPGDILSMLLTARDEETGRTLTDRELRDEIMAVMIAGHETSSAALTWTWYLLSQNPEAERKLLAELATVLGGRLPKLEDLPNLKFTRWAFEEAMRLYPPGYILGRRAMSDDVIDGYHIPAGTAVYLAPYATHRSAAIWKDPLTYDPERFSEAGSIDRPQTAFLPFGAGPRVCMGVAFAQMELQLVIATVAQQVRLAFAGNVPVEPVPVFTIRPKGGMPMRAMWR